MTDDDVIAEIDIRHRQTESVLHNESFIYADPLRIHADRAAMLAIVKRQQEREKTLREALNGIEIYGNDTLQERSPSRDWYVQGVTEMRDRARKALKGGSDV